MIWLLEGFSGFRGLEVELRQGFTVLRIFEVGFGSGAGSRFDRPKHLCSNVFN